MAEIVFLAGIGVFIIGGIGLLIAAFRTSILWGLLVLLIAPVAVIYLILHWQDAKGAFKLQLVGGALLLAAAYMSGDISLNASVDPGETLYAASSPASSGANIWSNEPTRQFRCDGRTHCSQMTSCEEATWFLRNCPNTKMDGNNDGIPCERQWCK